MDWPTLTPRLQAALCPGGYLADIEHETVPSPWSTLTDLVERHPADGGYQPFDLLTELERQGLFEPIGDQRSSSIPFHQSIAGYVESVHGRSGFSRERMSAQRAAAFDGEARAVLRQSHGEQILLPTIVRVVWGYPLKP